MRSCRAFASICSTMVNQLLRSAIVQLLIVKDKFVEGEALQALVLGRGFVVAAELFMRRRSQSPEGESVST